MIQHYACALNIPFCPTGTTMVSPRGLHGTLHCFRQLPGTPGEADESAPGSGTQPSREIAIGLAPIIVHPVYDY